jgi:ABC-2 type transport system permease protein
MITIIARKELTDMLRDGRFRWAAAIVLGLLAVALASGWTHYRSVAAQHEAAQQATREQWLAQGEKNPHSAAHYGVYAFKPKMPLSLVDRGVDSYVGVAAWLEAHRQNDFLYRPAQDGTVAQRLGELTAAGVLQLLMPLLIILLAFGAFAGEREQGTLRQLLSLGVGRRELALGKALGFSGALALLLVPAALVGAAALTLAMSGGAVAASLPRIALLAAGYLVYFGIFLAVSLAVSAWAPTSRLALVALLGFWIVNSLVAPRAVADVAKRVHPAPSAFAFQAGVDRDVRDGIDGRTPQQQRNEELRRQVLAQYGVERVEDLPVNFSGISLQAGEEYANLVYDKNFGEVWGIYGRQNRVHQVGALVAPLLAVRSLSMAVAGTDFEQHRDFARAAEEYRRVLNRMMNEHIAEHTEAGRPPVADADLWEEVPPFEYQAPTLASVLGNQRWSLFFLLGWLVVGGAVAMRAARRVPVD